DDRYFRRYLCNIGRWQKTWLRNQSWRYGGMEAIQVPCGLPPHETVKGMCCKAEDMSIPAVFPDARNGVAEILRSPLLVRLRRTPAHPVSRMQRVWLGGVDPVLLVGLGHVLGGELAFRGQRRDGRVRDVVAADLEVPAQVLAGVAAAVAVGAEHGVAHRHEGADLLGVGAHVVGRGDRRA